MLWDSSIQTDHEIEHNKPNIVLLNKDDKSCTIIDVACPFDIRIVNEGREKLEVFPCISSD